MKPIEIRHAQSRTARSGCLFELAVTCGRICRREMGRECRAVGREFSPRRRLESKCQTDDIATKRDGAGHIADENDGVGESHRPVPPRCRICARFPLMRKHVIIAFALFVAAGLSAAALGQAPAFKVEKFDIKGDGGTDYVSVEAATGRVFVSRGSHVMVVDGATGKVLGDIPNTPGVHGAGLATKAGHGFTTNGGDQTVTMFDLKTLEVIKQIKVGPGLDGIMYDEPDDKIILTNHSRPIGTLTAIDPKTGDIVATVELEDTAPEGAAADSKR